jgi:hypothetical protein
MGEAGKELAVDAAEKVESMFTRACQAIDQGLPAVGWSLEHVDWYPICGYNGDGDYLFLRHDGRPATYPHEKLGEKAPGGLALLSIVRPGSPPDHASAVRDALAFAAKMGRGGFSHGLYASGLDGYDAWIKALTELYPCQPGNLAAMRQRYEDAALRAKAIKALTSARAAEAEGLRVLGQIEVTLKGAGRLNTDQPCTAS